MSELIELLNYEYEVGSYASKDYINEEIIRISKLDYNQLFEELKNFNIKLEENKMLKEETTSDMCYYAYVGNESNLEEIIRYIEFKILKVLNDLNTPKLKELKSTSAKYNQIRSRKKEEIKNFSTYKPTGYKNIIKAFDRVFKGE